MDRAMNRILGSSGRWFPAAAVCLVIIPAIAIGVFGRHQQPDAQPPQSDSVPPDTVPDPSKQAQPTVTPASSTASLSTDGSDWPHWRGPRRNGISEETSWTAIWPEAGPPVRWKADVGLGYSSTAIDRGQLFTMGNRNGQEVISCLETASGDPVWAHSYQCALITKQDRGGPGATPSVTEDRVYTFGRRGQLCCLNRRTGDVLWEKDLVGEFQAKLPYWGCGCSPLLLGTSVIVDLGPVFAFDAETGALQWRTERDRAGYATPVPFRSNDEWRLAVLNSRALTIRRAADGSSVSEFPWRAKYGTNSTTPLLVDDTIFISTEMLGCALIRNNGDSLEQIYSHSRMMNQMNNSLLSDGHLYGISGTTHSRRSAQLVCMDLESGDIRWSERGFGVGALTMANDIMIILSEEGELITARANPQRYEEISRAQVLDERCWTVPVLSHGMIYCRNDSGHVVCLDVRDSST